MYYFDYIIFNPLCATMYALIYNKQFATITPQKNGARMHSVLSDVGIKRLRSHPQGQPVRQYKLRTICRYAESIGQVQT